MKQIALKGRTLLRKVLTALSLGAVAITFQACYGMPMPEEVPLNGTVKSSDTEEPIPGISVSTVYNYNPSFTDREGNYAFYVEDLTQTVMFRDVDGAENGEFHDKIVTWRSNDGPLNVKLDRKQ